MGEAAAEAAAGEEKTLADYAVEAIRHGWGDAYEIGHDDKRGYWARRRDGLGGDIAAEDPDELWSAIFADYQFRPVPRECPAALEALPDGR